MQRQLRDSTNNRNCVLFSITLARRQQRNLSVFKSSCHLPISLSHTGEASHCPFYCLTSSREAVNTNFFYNLLFDPPGIEHVSTALVVDALFIRLLILAFVFLYDVIFCKLLKLVAKNAKNWLNNS